MRSATLVSVFIVACCTIALSIVPGIHAQPALSASTKLYLPLLKSPPGLQTSEQQAMAAAVLTLINEQRIRAGCGPLTVDQRLIAAAQAHSRDMAENNYFDHRSPAGTFVGERSTSVGYAYWKVGENIAAGQSTPEVLVSGWLVSPSHRANILDCEFVHTGIGYVYQPNDQPFPGESWALYRYWTQVFGRPR